MLPEEVCLRRVATLMSRVLPSYGRLRALRPRARGAYVLVEYACS